MHDLSAEELEIKSDAKFKLDDALKDEEKFWSQCFRQMWIKDGDKCSKFFHKIMNSHGANNSINNLVMDGRLCKDQKEIEAQVLKYY